MLLGTIAKTLYLCFGVADRGIIYTYIQDRRNTFSAFVEGIRNENWSFSRLSVTKSSIRKPRSIASPNGSGVQHVFVIIR